MKKDHDGYILVTGGAGFIGSGLVQELNKRGFTRIIISDNLGQGEKWKNLVGKSFADIIHKDHLFSYLEDKRYPIQTCLHLGACSDTQEEDANYLLENNYRYTRRLCEHALKEGIRFIYASSAATYGKGEKGFSDDHALLELLQPLNMYGYSKHLFDLWALREGVLDSIVGLKYFNVFGPNEYHKGRMASALVKMVPHVLEKGYLSLFKSTDQPHYADGEQKRDFIYVKDCVRMTLAFMENEATGIYNIGSGHASTWNELARNLFNSLEMKEDIRYIDMPDTLRDKYQNFTEADMQKTKNVLLNDGDAMALEYSVKDYVQNYLIEGKRW